MRGRHRKKNQSMKTRAELQSLEKKFLNLEVCQRKENLVFYGIPEKEFSEGSEGMTVGKLKDFLGDELEMPLTRCVKFQRVHRFEKPKGSSIPRPLIARFSNYLDVVQIMQWRKDLNKE